MDWIVLIQQFGVSTVAIIAAAWALMRIGVFVATQLIVPIRDKHFAFLDGVQSSVKELAGTMGEMQKSMAENGVKLDSMLRKTDKQNRE